MEFAHRRRKAIKIRNQERYSPRAEVIPHKNLKLDEVLASNQDINELSQAFNYAIADWDYITERCMTQYQNRNGSDKAGYLLNLKGIIGELVMSDVIAGIIDSDDSTTQFIGEGKTDFHCTEEFIFRRQSPRMTVDVSYLRGGKSYTEYDSLLRYKKIPVIVETKIHTGVQSHYRNKTMFNIDDVSRKVFPLYDMDPRYFTPVGFIAVLLANGHPSSDLQLSFEKSGGIVTRLPISSEEFDYHVSKIAEQC